MAKRPKKSPVSDPYEQYAIDHAYDRARIWLYPYFEREPTLKLWIDAFAALDDPDRKDQDKLAVLLNSNHTLQHYASQFLFHVLEHYQEPTALCPQLLVKLKSDGKLTRDDRRALADLLQEPWTKTPGNRPPAYEETTAEFDLAEISAEVYELVDQGKDLVERLDRLTATGVSLEQAVDKVKNRWWSVKDKYWNQTAPDVRLNQVVDELTKSEGLSLEQAMARLISRAHSWTVDEAVTRISKLRGMAEAETITLLNRCKGKRRSTVLRGKFYEGLEKK
jgi:hypothetical protein